MNTTTNNLDQIDLYRGWHPNIREKYLIFKTHEILMKIAQVLSHKTGSQKIKLKRLCQGQLHAFKVLKIESWTTNKLETMY